MERKQNDAIGPKCWLDILSYTIRYLTRYSTGIVLRNHMLVLTLGTVIRGKRNPLWGYPADRHLDDVIQCSMVYYTMVVTVDLCMRNGSTKCWSDIRYLTCYGLVPCYGGYVGMNTCYPLDVSGYHPYVYPMFHP